MNKQSDTLKEVAEQIWGALTNNNNGHITKVLDPVTMWRLHASRLRAEGRL